MRYAKYVLCHGWMFVRPSSAVLQRECRPELKHRMNLPHKTRRRKKKDKKSKKRKSKKQKNEEEGDGDVKPLTDKKDDDDEQNDPGN